MNNDPFKKERGMFIIEVNDKTYYMRSHPRTMFHSMQYKKHDRFLAFLELGEFKDIVLDIRDLENYIKKVLKENN